MGRRKLVRTLGAALCVHFQRADAPAAGHYEARGVLTTLVDGVPVTVAGEEVLPIAVPHGHTTVFGYRIGALGYVTDAKLLPPAATDALRGVKVLVLNALFWTEHPTHMSVPQAIEAARAVGAERTYLTHLTHDNFHSVLESKLPAGVLPAYDGLTVNVS